MTSKARVKVPARSAADQERIDAIGRRLKRAHGQLGAVIRMFDEERSCNDIVIQMAAVSKAINTAAITLISENLRSCLVEGNSSSTETTEKLQKLFLSLA